MGAGCFCVAGAALGAPQSHCAWQVQHSVHLSVILRGMCSTRSTSREVRGSPATIEYYGRRLVLRGSCSTWSTSVSFCVAGAALEAPPERSAEVRRRLSTMGAGCFCVAGAALGGPRSHFAWQVQHLDTAHGATNFLHTFTIFGALSTFGALVYSLPSYPFCLIPPDTPLVFPRCGLFFVLFR